MKLQSFALAALLAIAPAAFAADDKHDHAAKHGGVVVETKRADLEIVAKPELLRIYVNGHDGKPLPLDGAKARLTLLNGSEKSDAELTPVDGKLEAKGAFKVAKGTKGVAVVTLTGKPPVTARFEVR